MASYRGGEVALAEVESYLRRGRESAAQDAQAMSAQYRQAAENLAVHRIVLDESADDSEHAADIGVGEGESQEEQSLEEEEALELARRQVTLELYFRRALDIPAVEEPDIEAFYAENQELFHQPEERFVWHLFRRHRDPPSETLDELARIRQRWLDGETFLQLARRYSESDTRIYDGRLGRVRRGRLAPAIDEIVFALGPDEISEPVEVPGGAALFYVSEATAAKRFTVEELREPIARRLRELRIDEHVAAEAAGTQAPPDALILERRELLANVAAANPGAEVLRIGSFRLTAGQLGQQVDRAMVRAGWWSSREERLIEIYRRHRDRSLLYLSLTRAGDLSDEEEQILDRRLESSRRNLRVSSLLRGRIYDLIDARPGALRAFYDDNAHSFQTSLRFKLRSLSLPVREDASRVLETLSENRDALVAGHRSLDQLAEELGAEVTEEGWIDTAALSAAAPKLRSHLLSHGLNDGFTLAFQLNDHINLIQIEDSEEPQALPFEEVREQVRQLYFERHQQSLYREVVDDVLGRRDFRFHEEVVLKAIAPPSLNAGPGAGPTSTGPT